MPVDPDMPIPLMLEQLRATSAWRLMSERLEKLIEDRMRTLVQLPGDCSLAEVQRLLGQIEALKMVLREPKQLQIEWERAIKRSPAHQTARAPT